MTTPTCPLDGRPCKPETWVEDHADSLYRYALSRVRNPDQAQEMVQETFLAALKSCGRYAGRSSLRTWLIGIMKHKIIDQFRKNSREKLVSDLEDAPDATDPHFDERGYWIVEPHQWGHNPLEAAEQSEFRTVLLRCIAQLPTGLADAFTLREMHDLESDEICRILNITPNNLWVRLHRARAHLRKILEEEWFVERTEQPQDARSQTSSKTNSDCRGPATTTALSSLMNTSISLRTAMVPAT